MTINSEWHPDVSDRDGPIYVAVADALELDVREGRLTPGARLPPQRELADVLDVTVGTVTRAYREAERRGLVEGHVGRGTFVRGPDTPQRSLGFAEGGLVDLGANYLRSEQSERFLARTLAELSRESGIGALIDDYARASGRDDHRRAAAEHLRQSGLQIGPKQVMITAGAQNAMLVALATQCRPGDAVLCGRVTYPGIVVMCRLLQLELHGLDMDAEGITAESFAAPCKKHRPSALYCMPTLSNPATTVMSDERRQAITDVADEHDVAIIEDDVYGFLVEPRPRPLFEFGAKRRCYISNLSKSVACGLRIGYLVVPPGEAGRYYDNLWGTALMTSPLTAEIATRWIREGTAAALISERRTEAAIRQKIAAELLAGHDYDAHPTGFHLWLRLPEPWTADAFVTCALRHGVVVNPGSSFEIAPGPSRAVRICTTSARSQESLRHALECLLSIFQSGTERPPV